MDLRVVCVLIVTMCEEDKLDVDGRRCFDVTLEEMCLHMCSELPHTYNDTIQSQCHQKRI